MPTLDPDSPLHADIAAIARISAVPMILRVVAETTGLRFSAVARVTDDTWVACAVYDKLGFGLEPGGTLEVGTTLCAKVRDTRKTVVMDQASQDPEYCDHMTPKMYGFESYISVPIFLGDGSYFGTICALDPLPAALRQPKVIEQIQLFAELLAVQLDAEARSEALRLSQLRLHAFVMEAPAAMAVFRGPELTFELANAGYRALVGDDREIIGKPARDALPELADSAVWDTIAHVYRTGEGHVSMAFPSRAASRDGRMSEQVYLDWSAQPTLGSDGKIDGVLFFAVDVTEAVSARLALEAKNRELDNFAYITSHDLKSPLRGIGNLAQWLEEDLGATLTATSRSHLALMKKRVSHMNTLIDGILRFARAGNVDKSRTEVDVAALLDEVKEMLAAPAGVRLEVGAMPRLHTSRVSLQQVFLNLVANAVQHAGRADANVTVTAKDEGDRWTFAVADNGPGIAAEHRERVWRLFQSLGGGDDAERSTGIGLSIVKKLVEARHGKVWIDSSPAGATFHFTWPKHELRAER